MKLISNFAIRGIFVIISKIISFVTIPIITQALGPINYGKYNYVLAVAAYATLPANWGFLAKGIREIASSDSDDQDSYIVSNIFSTRIILAFTGSILVMVLFVIFNDIKFAGLLFLALLHHLLMVTFIDYYYYGKKNVWLPTFAHFLSQIIYLVLVLVFINNPTDTYLLILFMVFMVFTESMILMIFAKRIKLTFKFSLLSAIQELIKNFNLGAGLKVGLIQSSYPIIIIPFFFSNEILGNYAATYKFYLLSSAIMQMVVLVVAPYIVNSKRYELRIRKKYINLYLLSALLLGLFLGIIINIYSSQVVNVLFGQKYILTPAYLKVFSLSVLSISPLFIALSSIMSNYSLDKHFMLGAIVQGITILIFTPIVLSLFNINMLILLLGISMFLTSLYYLYSLKKNYII